MPIGEFFLYWEEIAILFDEKKRSYDKQQKENEKMAKARRYGGSHSGRRLGRGR